MSTIETNSSKIVQFFERKETNAILFDQLSILTCIDISGSTSNKCPDNMTVLGRQFNICSEITGRPLVTSIKFSGNYFKYRYISNETQKLICWDNNAVLNPQNEISPTGLTIPSKIFDNEITSAAFNMAPIIIFSTDGQIQQNEVTNFSDKINSQLNNKIIVIGLIVCNKRSLNVSVIAPLLRAPNFLCLWNDIDTNITHTIISTGTAATYFPCPEFTDNYHNPIDLSQIKKMNMFAPIEIPPGFVILSSTNDQIKTINFDNFNLDLDESDIDLLLELKKSDWLTIIRHSFTVGKSDLIKSIASKIKLRINNIRAKLQYEYDNNSSNLTYKEQLNILVNEVNKLNPDQQIIDYARKLVIQMRDEIQIESARITRQINDIIRPNVAIVELIQSIVSEIEVAGNSMYNANVFLCSNRAKRATNVIDVDLDHIQVIDEASPLQSCLVCLEDSHLVL